MFTIEYFFGVLTIMSIMMVVGIIVGAVKMSKMKRELDGYGSSIEDNMTTFDNFSDEIYRSIDEEVGRLKRSIEQNMNDLDIREVGIYRRIDSKIEAVKQTIDSKEREIHSVMDSRMDKLLTKIS